MNMLMNTIKRFSNDESGATAIEYGLIAALVAVVVIGALQLVGTELQSTFASISDGLAGATEEPTTP